MWAHSCNEVGARQELSEHARSVADLARGFGRSFGAGELAYALGLFHDAGKARTRWQEGLCRAERVGGPVGVPHKDLGAHLLRPTAGVAALAILGHHGGLSSVGELRDLAVEDGAVADASVARFLGELPEAEEVLGREALTLLPEAWSTPLQCEMGMRLVFSALVDADHLDTAAHFAGRGSPSVGSDADMSALRDRFEVARRRLLADRETAEVDRLREQVYRTAVEYAVKPPGMYRMPAPTGVGKTLSAAGFGLHHAAEHGHQRVIVAVPFVSVTEQNAAVYRQLLGPDVVLEHHSAVRLDESGESERLHRGAVENWDSPFVVTTTVQLFDSLFARTPARMRKLHRLANSVLILDEVQALPTRVLVPILDALRTLSEVFGTTVLLTSATQPSFQSLTVWQDLPVVDVVEDPVELFRRMRRARYEWWLDPQPQLSEVAEQAGGYRQVLVVVNTIADARRVYQQWQDTGVTSVYHLSTRMCPRHRHAVLKTVRSRLATGEPVRLVSTQLIEAGVDVDFPVVYRAVAPAEALQQAAGRANREGRLEQGTVVVFDAADMSAPAGYRIGTATMRDFFGPGEEVTVDPDDVAALDRYYRALYQRSNTEHGQRARSIQDSRQAMDFTAVAEGPLVRGNLLQTRDHALAFRMLDDDTVPVVVPDYEAHAEQLLQLLANAPEQAGAVVRQLQPYIVALPRRVMQQDSAVHALCQPVWADLHVWRGEYHPAYGIDTANLINEEVW